MSERSHLVTHRAQSRVRMQPWRILACLAALLAAAALTYGWDTLTGASPIVPMLPFGVRAALSTLLVFLGAFALTGLWLSPAASAPLAEAVVVPALVNVPATEDAREYGADPLPPHIPVRASDLPRILFDTGEFSAITANDESEPKRPGRRATKPLAWPQPILPPDWPDD